MADVTIDVNCDMGERPEALDDGSEEKLMELVTSANIACGGHAGDFSTMKKTVALAERFKVGVGAHPGYPDRANFGRTSMKFSRRELSLLIYEQVRSLAAFVRGRELRHLKPHGALYHDASSDPAVAGAIADAASMWSRDLVLIGLSGSPMLIVWKGRGFITASEAFADRRYEPDGSLRSRRFPDALLADPASAAEQALSIVRHGAVKTSNGSTVHVDALTICVHSDTPGSAEILRSVRNALTKDGVRILKL